MIEVLPYMPEGFEPEQQQEDETADVDIDTIRAMCDVFYMADLINAMEENSAAMQQNLKNMSMSIVYKLTANLYFQYFPE